MNGIHEVTGSIPVWSTKLPIHRKHLQKRRLSGSIALHPSSAKTFISNEIHFPTKPGSNRSSFLPLLIEIDVDEYVYQRVCLIPNCFDLLIGEALLSAPSSSRQRSIEKGLESPSTIGFR